MINIAQQLQAAISLPILKNKLRDLRNLFLKNILSLNKRGSYEILEEKYLPENSTLLTHRVKTNHYFWNSLLHEALIYPQNWFDLSERILSKGFRYETIAITDRVNINLTTTQLSDKNEPNIHQINTIESPSRILLTGLSQTSMQLAHLPTMKHTSSKLLGVVN